MVFTVLTNKSYETTYIYSYSIDVKILIRIIIVCSQCIYKRWFHTLIMVKKFSSIPITPETKSKLKELTYDLRVDSYDAAIIKLIDFFKEKEKG